MIGFSGTGLLTFMISQGNAETCTAIIAFCLPAFRILIIQRRQTSKAHSSSNNGHISGPRSHPRSHSRSLKKSGLQNTLDYELEESLRSESEERLRTDSYRHSPAPVVPQEGGIYVSRDIKVTTEPAGLNNEMGSGMGIERPAHALRRSETEVFAGPEEYGRGVRPWRP